MDEGPFRMPRPADRSADNKPEPQSPPNEPQSTKEHVSKVEPKEPKPVQRSASPMHHNPLEVKSRKRFILPIIIAIVVIVIVVGGLFAWKGMKSAGTAIDGSKYQAVFFTNGQVYFGKLQSFSAGYMKLTDVYYLQSKATTTDDSKLQSTSDNANLDNVSLIKLGQEIHGPEDEMVISRDQVLFYENLKSDGKVSQAIASYKSK